MEIQEEWRDVVRSPNYMVSSLGRVRRKTNASATHAGRIVKPCPARGGYLRVSLWTDCKMKSANIHQLVCEAFIGPRPSSNHEAAHSNGIRSDNRLCNLSWKTKSENAADRVTHGTMNFGERCRLSKFTEEIVLAVREASGTHREIGARFGMSKSNVSYIKSRRHWSHL